MAGPYTWGEMAKSAGDTQTVDEAIAAAIAAHNASDDAHGQSSEAIYNHRIAEILDHLEDSVLPEHIANSIIYIDHLIASADVSLDGDNEFHNITGCSTTITASKACKVLLIATILFANSGFDANLATRFKITDTEDTYYYPNESGFYTVYPGASESAWKGHITFVWEQALIAGSNTITLQCSRSAPDETITVYGDSTYPETNMAVIIIGAEIT